jgi:glycolate oxidase subunit GlcD
MLEELSVIVGDENFSMDEAEVIAYSKDFSYFQEKPLCVVRPKSREEIIKIVKFASVHKIPIIPRGTGTNTCGEVLGKAIVVDLTRMNKILRIKEKDLHCVVQAGVVLHNLNKALKKKGFFFPPDPASSKVCTIGGMVANNSSGLHAVKYGTTKDYVLGLEAILPSGDVIKTGSKAQKSSSGYNLSRLFVGSEGTLGIFTQITLKILPLPRYSETITLGFEDIASAGEAITKILAVATLSALELMDEICLEALKKRYNLDFKSKWVLILEFDGNEKHVKNDIKKVREFILERELNIENIWDYRKKLVPSLINYSKDKVPLAITEDIGVPVAKVMEAILKIKEIYATHGFEVAIYGHAGDGNLHMRVFAEENAIKKVLKAGDEVYDYVLSINGTTTSEHGVGLLRAKYMKKEHGIAFNTMKKIKRVFDPDNIMNPGKMGL